MKKNSKIKKLMVTTFLISGFVLPITAYAASAKSFTYQFKHQLTIRYAKTTSSKLHVTTNTSTFGGSKGFVMKLYKDGRLVDSRHVLYPRGTETFSVQKGKQYGVEFWKAQDNKYVKGTGKTEF